MEDVSLNQNILRKKLVCPQKKSEQTWLSSQIYALTLPLSGIVIQTVQPGLFHQEVLKDFREEWIIRLHQCKILKTWQI